MYARNLLNKKKILFASVHLSDFVCNTGVMTKNILPPPPNTSGFASATQTWQHLALAFPMLELIDVQNMLYIVAVLHFQKDIRVLGRKIGFITLILIMKCCYTLIFRI